MRAHGTLAADLGYAFELEDDWSVLLENGGETLHAMKEAIVERKGEHVSVRPGQADLTMTSTTTEGASLQAFATERMRRTLPSGEPDPFAMTQVDGAEAIAYAWVDGVRSIGTWIVAVAGRFVIIEGRTPIPPDGSYACGLTTFAPLVLSVRWERPRAR